MIDRSVHTPIPKHPVFVQCIHDTHVITGSKGRSHEPARLILGDSTGVGEYVGSGPDLPRSHIGGVTRNEVAGASGPLGLVGEAGECESAVCSSRQGKPRANMSKTEGRVCLPRRNIDEIVVAASGTNKGQVLAGRHRVGSQECVELTPANDQQRQTGPRCHWRLGRQS